MRTPRQRFQWETGYRDGYLSNPIPKEPAWDYQLGWTAGNSDRLDGKPRPEYAPLLERKNPPR